MSSIDEIRDIRIKKLELLKSRGLNPYPAESNREISLKEAIENFDNLEKTKDMKWIAGRVMSIRGQGAIVFITLNDGTASFQGLFKKDILGDDKFSFFNEVVDIGDFIEIKGSFFATQRKEKTLEVKDWRMLSKSLRPLPEKWHGLVDVEERFRKRYLDILMNGEVKGKAIVRSKIISALRSFLDNEGFLEVETPVLQTLAGGTSARPFKTHHNTLDIDLNLRIALEIHLKQLLVGGLPKVYEMGRIFRNEGIDATHNPEFTMLEAYAAYWDEEQLMKFIEKLTGELAKTVSGNKAVVFGENKISFKPPFKRINFFDALERYAMIMDYGKKTRDELVTIALRFGLNPEPHDSKGKIADKIFAKVCRPK